MYVKICGITCAEDLELARIAGATAVGLNLVPGSSREIPREAARALAAVAAGRIETVAVVRDIPPGDLRALREDLGVDWLQVHDEVACLPTVATPGVFFAVRVGGAEDVERARAVPGERVLTDAKVNGALGGTGRAFDWSLVAGLARERRLVLAGGLHPGNVAAAVAAISPFGVDVATGVERPGEPRRKDPERVRAFVTAALSAERGGAPFFAPLRAESPLDGDPPRPTAGRARQG